jgi:hypothetical protein
VEWSSHENSWNGSHCNRSFIGDQYTPRKAVRRMHNMPHLDSDLNTVDNTFAISASSTSNEYMMSLVIFPVILGAIGFIILLGYESSFVGFAVVAHAVIVVVLIQDQSLFQKLVVRDFSPFFVVAVPTVGINHSVVSAEFQLRCR